MLVPDTNTLQSAATCSSGVAVILRVHFLCRLILFRQQHNQSIKLGNCIIVVPIVFILLTANIKCWFSFSRRSSELSQVKKDTATLEGEVSILDVSVDHS